MKKQQKNLRREFVELLMELAQKDSGVTLLVGDVGFSYFEEFKEKFPHQFINCGVLEQTMMGIAAGLALSGRKPYVYSMIPFVTMRCYEQVRNDVCYHKANVKIIGVKGSEYYKFLGFSHNITKNEDLEILKPLPNIRCYIPQNAKELRKVIFKTYKMNCPTYVRV